MPGIVSLVMTDYAQLILYLLLGIALGGLVLVIPQLLGPRTRGAMTEQTYECGVDTIGSAWMRFSASYYVFALIFVAFEVDVLYLLPVAVAFADAGLRGFIEITIFIAILSLAIIYAWRKGVFEWQAHRAPQSRSIGRDSDSVAPAP